MQKGLKQGLHLAKRRLLVSLEIPSKDHSYTWVLKWMERQQAVGLRTMLKSHELAVETNFVRRENGSTETHFALLPGPGKHYFRYQGAWFQVERQRATKMIDLKSGSPWETVMLTTLSRDRKLFPRILEEAKSLALSSEEGKTVIYASYGPEWRPSGIPRRKRPLASVVLQDSISDQILGDVKRFMAGGKWYYDRGIPYRRGYLLYGPPGSGKTSYILALAGELDYNICVLNLSERGMTDDRLSHLLSHAPPRSLILLEDIDAAFTKRSQSDSQGYQGMVTFSGLLNALDGVTSTEERIIFMTTNHMEKLDPALIRPGRVDAKMLIDNVSTSQAKKLFLRFYENEENLAESFVQALVKEDGTMRTLSAAQIQGHFVIHRDNPQAALDLVEDLFR